MFEAEKNVHPSFWTPDPGGGELRIEYPNESFPTERLPLSDQPHFLHWRLRRLNKAYREAVSELWEQKREALAPFQPFAKDFSPDEGETFDQWQQRHHELSLEYLGILSEGQKWEDIRDAHDRHYPPIPFEVRFPLPGLLAFLTTLPRRRGPIPDWRQYLLAYEMHLSKVNDAKIARELLGLPANYTDKHPAFVRLRKIKRVMEPLIEESFGQLA